VEKNVTAITVTFAIHPHLISMKTDSEFDKEMAVVRSKKTSTDPKVD
jgi:hypothetical protein